MKHKLKRCHIIFIDHQWERCDDKLATHTSFSYESALNYLQIMRNLKEVEEDLKEGKIVIVFSTEQSDEFPTTLEELRLLFEGINPHMLYSIVISSVYDKVIFTKMQGSLKKMLETVPPDLTSDIETVDGAIVRVDANSRIYLGHTGQQGDSTVYIPCYIWNWKNNEWIKLP